jgi:muramidase (phage lysozyme)
MMQAVVPILDECGRLVKGHVLSEEYKRIRERGLVVDDVMVESVRFEPAVEDQILQQWNTSWLANAAMDRRHVEQLEMLAGQAGRQRALLEHASALSTSLRTSEPPSVEAAVKNLIQSSQHEILADERISTHGGPEIESLSELLKWIDSGDHG